MELDGSGENYSKTMEKAYIGSSKILVVYKTLIEFLSKRRKERGNDEAYVWYSKTMKRISLTYNEWYERSLIVASDLSSTIQKGDLVCLFCTNGKDPIITLTALQILGAKTCLVAAERHLKSIITSVKFKAIFLDKEFLTVNVKSLIKDVDKIFMLDGKLTEGQTDFEMFTNDGLDFLNNLPVVNPDDVTLLLLSSGSTGTPKLICKDQMSVVHMGVEVCELTQSKNFFNDRTLAHLGGLFSVFCSALGQTVVSTTVPMAKTSENILEICQGEKVGAAFFVLYFFFDLLEMRKEVGEYLRDLKCIITGGQMPVKSVIKQFNQILPKVSIYDCYGSTEVGSIYFKGLQSSKRFFLTASQEVSIRDDDGRVLKRNETGEIWIRSHCGFHGYYGRKPIHALSWQKMSDIGFISTNGCLEVLGRTTDLLHIGMLKVNPFTYEEKINELSEVEKAIVVGIPDERLGETMCVVVKLSKEYSNKTSTEEAKEFIKRWCLENIKGNENLGLIIKVEKVHILEGEWPRTSLGKLIRKDVQQLVTDKLRKSEM